MQLGKILIIDGSNLLHRQLTQPTLWDLKYNGRRTGAVFGFLRSLSVILARFPAYYPIVIFDKGRSARRLALYPNYKRTEDAKQEHADRAQKVSAGLISKDSASSELNEELYRQGDVIRVLLGVLKIPVLTVRGWEGDDLMAMVATLVEDGIIVSDDKDLYQLLSGKIQIFRPIRTDAEGHRGELVTFDKVKHPVFNNARSYIVHKAIVGDTSDNIPKISQGLGEKRAEVLTDYIISMHEDPSIYLEIMKSMKEPYFKKFIEAHDQYLINMQLIDLSLVKMDYYILEELAMQLESCKGIPQLMDVVKTLSLGGIESLGYTRLISHITRTQQEVRSIHD